MTVEELIARLEDIRDDLGRDTEVRLMTQQNWPFENRIEGLCSSREIAEAYDEDEEDEDYGDEPVVLFIVEGTQLGYGTKKAWEVCS
jgi:hypothetical protein